MVEVAVIVATKAKQPAVQISRLRRHETDEIELYCSVSRFGPSL